MLHLLVFFGDLGAVAVFAVLALAATTSSTTSATASASATLQMLASLRILAIARRGGGGLWLVFTLPRAISSGLDSQIGCVRNCDARVEARSLRLEILKMR